MALILKHPAPGIGVLAVVGLVSVAFSPVLAYSGSPPGLPFTEEAQIRGINYLTSQPANPINGFGVAFVDLDDDGDADLITLGRADNIVGVYENDGTGFFIDRSSTTGIGPLSNPSGVSAADFDRDGDLDLYITRWTEPNVLLRNDGGFTFTDVTLTAGVGDSEKSQGACWGDYDLDGQIDLYVSNQFAPNRLYHNLGNGVFEEVAAALGVDRGQEGSFQAAFFDYDGDGDADLFVSTIRGFCIGPVVETSHLFQNNNGVFTDVTAATGTETCVDAMCVAIGDLDGNSRQDIFVSNVPEEIQSKTHNGNALLLNNPTGDFSYASPLAGITTPHTGWGSVFFDYDNDGHLDLYVCNWGSNQLYHNPGTFPLTEVATLLSVDTPGLSFTTALSDIDLDGDLDILVQSTDQNLRMYINHEGETRRWVRLNVIGEGANRYAIGAIVRARTGLTWRLREVIAGCNFKSQNDLVQLIGVNDALLIDEMQTTWPGGTTRTVFNYPTNQSWSIYPPDKLGDADEDGQVTLADFFAFTSCVNNPVAPGCEMMDFDGDGLISNADFSPFLAAYDQPLPDCDANGQPDLLDILLDPTLDYNQNGVPASCEGACTADCSPVYSPGTYGNGIVNIEDLVVILGAFGQTGGPCDASPPGGNGAVNIDDLIAVLGAFGPCPP